MMGAGAGILSEEFVFEVNLFPISTWLQITELREEENVNFCELVFEAFRLI